MASQPQTPFQRVGRPTGPGKVRNLLAGSRPDVVCIYHLYNFNIDGSVLKPEHKKFLDENLIPLLKSRQVHAELTGTTSKSGDRQYNRDLSLSRVLHLKDYLRSNGIPESKVPGPDIRAAGEDRSTSQVNEDELDRAVQIVVALGIKPLPIPRHPEIVIPVVITGDPEIVTPPPMKDPTPQTENWTIREIFGTNMGVGIPGLGMTGAGISAGGVQYHFLLVHRRKKLMAQCTFAGGQLSVGPGADIGGSITEQSHKWNNFSTAPGTDFSNLEGQATWVESGTLGLGTSIAVPPKLMLHNVNISVEVDTGATWGFPSSSTAHGFFTCKKPVQLHL